MERSERQQLEDLLTITRMEARDLERLAKMARERERMIAALLRPGLNDAIEALDRAAAHA